MKFQWTFDIIESKREEVVGHAEVTITEDNWNKMKKVLDVETPMPVAYEKIKIDISEFVQIDKINMGRMPILKPGVKPEIYAWVNGSYIAVDGKYPGHKGYNGMEIVSIDLTDDPRRNDPYYVSGLPSMNCLEKFFSNEMTIIDFINQ